MARSRPRWTYPVAAFLGAGLLRLMRLTWRIDERPERHVEARRRARGSGPGTLYVLWHSRILLGTATQTGLALHVLISQHGDGEYIARTVEHLGFRTIRGSSTRGGPRALREIVDVLTAGGDVAITPDGPKGPALRVQRGCVDAASVTGAPIVPVGLDCRSAKRLRSWDRFVVPWFFTRVAVRFGDEIRVPRELDDTAAAEWCDRVAAGMADVNAETATLVGIEAERP